MPWEWVLDWIEYTSEIGPFGNDRQDLMMGMLLAQGYNMNRGKNSPPMDTKSFMPYYHEKPPTPQELEEKLKAAFGR